MNPSLSAETELNLALRLTAGLVGTLTGLATSCCRKQNSL